MPDLNERAETRKRLEEIGRASGMAANMATNTAAICDIVERLLPNHHPASKASHELRLAALRASALLDETLKRCP